MISKVKVRELVEERMAELDNGLFIVELNISSSNAIYVELDKHEGGVSVEDCIRVSRNVEHNLDREEQDFELHVSSAGLDKGLRVFAQYLKNIGRKVKVKFNESGSIEGELIAATQQEITVQTTRKERIEGRKKKNIDKQTMQHVLEDVFRAMLKKKFNTDEHIDVIVNIDKGDVQIFLNKEIVDDGEVEDSNIEIAYSEAIKIEPDFEIGEEVTEEFKFSDFGRRNILSLRQNLISRIMELEKDHLYKLYKERIGEIITGEVYQVWKKEIMVIDDEGNELILPKSEQIPSDYFKKGESIRAVVAKVDMRNSSPVIILSRTAPEFLERLFELEVPEVFDGLITIKRIVREPGERAKVAVESYDDRVDPVGACVGMKGSRIHGIVRE